MTERSSQPNSPYYKLLSHNFVVTVLQNTSPLYSLISSSIKDQGIKAKVDIKEHTNRVLNEIHSSNLKQYLNFQYHNEVFHYMSNITHAIERMEMTPIFLKRFSRSKTYDQNGITLHRWIQYHYSNYLITVTGIYDTALLLTNAVFVLGVKPRKCNDNTIKNNSQVKQSPVKTTLDQLNEIVKNYREPRNLFAHRNIIPDLEMLDELEDLRFIERVEEQLDTKPEPIIHPGLVELLYQSERRKLVQTIREETNSIAARVYQLFTDLHAIYSNVVTSIEKSDLPNGKD